MGKHVSLQPAIDLCEHGSQHLFFPIGEEVVEIAALKARMAEDAWNSLAANPSLPRLIVVHILLGAMVGLYMGPAPTLVATMFPVEVRSSGFSLAYNFAVTIFGNFAPFISTWLVGLTGSKLAVTFYVLAAVLVSLVSLACLEVGSKAVMSSGKQAA